jgi:hypothetical protein
VGVLYQDEATRLVDAAKWRLSTTSTPCMCLSVVVRPSADVRYPNPTSVVPLAKPMLLSTDKSMKGRDHAAGSSVIGKWRLDRAVINVP